MSAATSPIRRLLPEGLKPRSISVSPSGLTVHAEVAAASAGCPLCGKHSSKVHSRYERTIADLPWRNVSVTLKIRARRFFCVNPNCERAIFCERLPEVAAYARKTDRLEEALLLIAFELGGEAGSRLAHELGLLVSPEALLQRLRGAPSQKTDEVRVLGIDTIGPKGRDAATGQSSWTWSGTRWWTCFPIAPPRHSRSGLRAIPASRW
ncbi:MAG: transposase family protein [Actinobacteria bacterium]|nr:transposase family protein [Actinomycetota bacterium]